MIASQLSPSDFGPSASTILQFPTEANRAVRSLRHMTTQLLQEAAQVIPNQQLLINVVSKRVRQLGLGHRPMVETTPRMSLTDIALKEIVGNGLPVPGIAALEKRNGGFDSLVDGLDVRPAAALSPADNSILRGDFDENIGHAVTVDARTVFPMGIGYADYERFEGFDFHWAKDQ